MGLRIPAGTVEFRLPLDTLFHRFVTTSNDHILVLCEAGVVAVDGAGVPVWRLDTDVIQRWAIEEERLFLEFIDDEPVYVSVDDGSIVTRRR